MQIPKQWDSGEPWGQIFSWDDVNFISVSKSAIFAAETVCLRKVTSVGRGSGMFRNGFSKQIQPPFLIPRCSMYGIFTCIYPKFMINVGKYAIHGAYGIGLSVFLASLSVSLQDLEI